VEIYIDGKLTKKTDFFFGSALVENLLPKKYQIRIEKEGYLPWEKTLEIKEREVNEVKNIVLFPKDLNFRILTKKVENFWFSPDGKKIILKEKEDEDWTLKLYDLDKNLKSHLISGKEIYSKGADFLNLQWAENSKEIYLDVGIKEQEKNFSLRLDKSPPQLTERKIAEIPENIIASKEINNDLYYLDNLGYLFKNERKLNETSFPIQPETEYDLEVFQDFIFLREGKILYLLNPESKSFEKFFEPIENLKVSPDNKKLAFFSNSEIWIFFLKETNPPTTPLHHRAGDRLLLSRLSEKIGDIFWLNSDYLIFSCGDNLEIIETDERDRIQIWLIENFPKPEIYFNASDKKLYMLSEGNLYQFETLIK
jgi:dipeptidyl aminopeptidase/acylaminoacyl peptidase